MSLPKGIEDQFSSEDLANIQRALNKPVTDEVIPAEGMRLWTADVDVIQNVQYHKRMTRTFSVPVEITNIEDAGKYFGDMFTQELDATGDPDAQIEGTHSHGSSVTLGFLSIEPKDEDPEQFN